MHSKDLKSEHLRLCCSDFCFYFYFIFMCLSQVQELYHNAIVNYWSTLLKEKFNIWGNVLILKLTD